MAKERVRSVQSMLSPPKNAPKWTLASEYNITQQSFTEVSSGGSSSRTSEQISGSGSSHTPESGSSSGRYHHPLSLSSGVSLGNTPHTATSTSRPRNLLNDIYSSAQASRSTADDIIEQIGNDWPGSGSSSDSFSSDYD